MGNFDAVLRSPRILRANVATTRSVNDRSMQDSQRIRTSGTTKRDRTRRPYFTTNVRIPNDPTNVNRAVINTSQTFVVSAFYVKDSSIAASFSCGFRRFIMTIRYIFRICQDVIRFVFVDVITLFRLGGSLRRQVIRIVLRFQDVWVGIDRFLLAILFVVLGRLQCGFFSNSISCVIYGHVSQD